MTMPSTCPRTSPRVSPAALPLPAHILDILRNWSASSVTDIFPRAVHPTVDPSSLSDPLFLELHELSCLTVNQRERAHSLLDTYFQCRIREGSYSGRQERIYAGLEMEDVEKAIVSVRRMSKGLKMENKEGEGSEGVGTGKRKYSIRGEDGVGDDDEDGDEDARASKKIKSSGWDGVGYVRIELDTAVSPLISLPSMSPGITLPSPADILSAPQEVHAYKSKRPISLPPINTSVIHTPTIHFAGSAHSLYPRNTTDPTLYSTRPMPTDPPMYNTQPPSTIPPFLSGGSPEFTASSLPYAEIQMQKHPAVQAAQQATHEYNVCRLELVNAERWYTEARRRCVDAKRRMERAAKRARDDRC